jgi:hypothetical protein
MLLNGLVEQVTALLDVAQVGPQEVPQDQAEEIQANAPAVEQQQLGVLDCGVSQELGELLRRDF